MVKVSEKLTDIFEKYNLSPERVNFLFNETRIVSKTELDQTFQKGVDGDDWDDLDHISWFLWKESGLAVSEKIRLGFEFYELFPLYYQGLNPVYEAFRDEEIQDKDLRKIVFDKFATYLSSDDFVFYSSTQYILWVEFFEARGDLARETWISIINSKNLTEKGKVWLLRISGPAPIDLKEALYYELLKNEMYHNDIFDALVYSLYDVYGLFDIEVVKKVFVQLKNIDTSSKNYKAYQEKVSSLSNTI